MPTAHSALPLNKLIHSQEFYVWPDALGELNEKSALLLKSSQLASLTLLCSEAGLVADILSRSKSKNGDEYKAQEEQSDSKPSSFSKIL